MRKTQVCTVYVCTQEKPLPLVPACLCSRIVQFLVLMIINATAPITMSLKVLDGSTQPKYGSLLGMFQVWTNMSWKMSTISLLSEPPMRPENPFWESGDLPKTKEIIIPNLVNLARNIQLSPSSFRVASHQQNSGKLLFYIITDINKQFILVNWTTSNVLLCNVCG